MPKGLRRWYGGGDLHYITCSCYQRQPFLGSAPRRDLFLKILEQVRQKYEFQVVGYVVMPEPIHLLIGEPDDGSVAVIMQVLKQRVGRQCLARGRSRFPEDAAPPPFWYPRSYDFNVFSQKKVGVPGPRIKHKTLHRSFSWDSAKEKVWKRVTLTMKRTIIHAACIDERARGSYG